MEILKHYGFFQSYSCMHETCPGGRMLSHTVMRAPKDCPAQKQMGDYIAANKRHKTLAVTKCCRPETLACLSPAS